MRFSCERYLTAFAILCSASGWSIPTSAFAASHADSERPLIFGFLPIVSPDRLVRRFDPLVDYVAARLGVAVRLETAPDYAEFVRRTEAERRYDLLFTAPHFYYAAQRSAGYRVVVRVGGRPMYAVIVTRRDSGIRFLEDLRGKNVATPDALALGTMLVAGRLKMAGLIPGKDVTLVTTPSHNASLLSAFEGFTAAAGLKSVPYGRTRPRIRKETRLLAETDSTPNMPFSVRSGLAPRHAEAFAATLIGMTASAQGRAVLKHLNWPSFVAAWPKEYDVLRRFVERN